MARETLSTGAALVDFWAAWCVPCQTQGPIVEEVAEAMGERATVAKVDVESAQALAQKFGVMSIPTLLVFKDGKPAERIVGYMPKERLMDKIKPHI